MKEGWTYKKLGEVAKVIHGKNQKEVQSPDGRYPIYGSGGNIMGYASDYLCEAGTTILGRKGSINNPMYINERFWNVDTAFGIVPINGNISKFIYYFVKSVNWSEKNTGTTLPSLTQQVVTRVILPVPSLSEQQRIVAQLDEAFAEIDMIKAEAEKQLSDAKTLFQKALSQAMTPKEGWEKKKLGDIGTFSRGINFIKSDFVKEGYPCIHYGQIHTVFGNATYKHLTCIPKEKVREDKLASKGDLIIAITSEDVEASCKCTAWMGDYDIAVGAHAAIYKHNLNPVYVSYFFQSSSFQNEKELYTHGFKVVEIKPADICKIHIYYPSPSDQQRIVEELDELSENVKEIEALNNKLTAECDAMKQALLRQVFE